MSGLNLGNGDFDCDATSTASISESSLSAYWHLEKRCCRCRPLQMTEFRRVVHLAHNQGPSLIGVIFPEGRLWRTPTPTSNMAEARLWVNAGGLNSSAAKRSLTQREHPWGVSAVINVASSR
jgi:hypothetical protein